MPAPLPYFDKIRIGLITTSEKNREVCILQVIVLDPALATAHFSDGECAQLKEECNLGATPRGGAKGGDFGERVCDAKHVFSSN